MSNSQKPQKHPRRASKLRELLVNPPSQSMPPEIFRALFLDEDESRAIRKFKDFRGAMRDNPVVTMLFGLSPRRKAGRPKESYKIDLEEATAIAFAIGTGGLTKGDVLQALREIAGRDPYRWLDRRLKRVGGVEAWKDERLISTLSFLKPTDRKQWFKSFLREVCPEKKVQ